MSKSNSQKGFVALISILIVSVVLLATTISLAQFGLASRYFILDMENKNVSEKLAEACVHTSRILVYNDPTYEVTNRNIDVGGAECTIVSIEQGAPPNDDKSTIEASATNGNSVTNIRVLVDNTDGDFESWTEVGSF